MIIFGHLIAVLANVPKKSNNFFNVNFHHHGGVLTSKLWAPLNPACQDASFGTLQSLIGHMVPEILTAGKIQEEQQQEEQEEYNRFI